MSQPPVIRLRYFIRSYPIMGLWDYGLYLICKPILVGGRVCRHTTGKRIIIFILYLSLFDFLFVLQLDSYVLVFCILSLIQWVGIIPPWGSPSLIRDNRIAHNEVLLLIMLPVHTEEELFILGSGFQGIVQRQSDH